MDEISELFRGAIIHYQQKAIIYIVGCGNEEQWTTKKAFEWCKTYGDITSIDLADSPLAGILRELNK